MLRVEIGDGRQECVPSARLGHQRDVGGIYPSSCLVRGEVVLVFLGIIPGYVDSAVLAEIGKGDPGVQVVVQRSVEKHEGKDRDKPQDPVDAESTEDPGESECPDAEAQPVHGIVPTMSGLVCMGHVIPLPRRTVTLSHAG